MSVSSVVVNTELIGGTYTVIKFVPAVVYNRLEDRMCLVCCLLEEVMEVGQRHRKAVERESRVI